MRFFYNLEKIIDDIMSLVLIAFFKTLTKAQSLFAFFNYLKIKQAIRRFTK